MRRLLAVFVLAAAAATLVVAGGAGAGPNGSGNGTMCVFNAQLKPEPGSTSAAKGHVQIKVRNNGTIEYKAFILNKEGEQFIAGHIHQRANETDFAGPPVVHLLEEGASDERHIRDRGEIEADTPAEMAFARQICEHPELFYVNYHTPQFLLPIAALRGELA